MIVEKLLEMKQKKIRLYPAHTNRASELGHPCERYLVFKRTRWEEAAPHDVTLQFIFDEGALHETAILRDLAEAGFQLIEQQRDFEDKATKITGHIDAKIVVDGSAYPLEAKSMSPYIWKQINSVEDLLRSKFPHLQKYPAQVQLYMYLANAEKGVLLLKDKLTGQLKEIWMTMDYEYVEGLLKKAESINRHVEEGTVPDPIRWKEETCGRCAFTHICLPEARRDALDLTDDQDLEAKLSRRATLDPLRSEYEQIDAEIKEAVRERPKVLCGNYLITGKWIEPKGKARYWKSSIESLTPTQGGVPS